MNAYIKYLWLKDFVYFASASCSRGSKGIEIQVNYQNQKQVKFIIKKEQIKLFTFTIEKNIK